MWCQDAATSYGNTTDVMTVVGGSVYNAEDKGKRKHLIAKAFCVKRFYLLKVFQKNLVLEREKSRWTMF